MKLFTVIKKNFLLLFRSKTSSIVILLGPLLVVLLIGLAFNNLGSDYLLEIGVYSETYTESAEIFIDGLNEQYEVTKFDTNETCINSVKEGSSNLCILFPKNMALDDELQDELVLYIDESRINLVDTVVNRISSIIGVSSESTSKDLTASLLSTIILTKSELESNLLSSVNIKQNTDVALADINIVETDVSSMDLEIENVDLNNIDLKVDEFYLLADSVKSQALSAIDDAIGLVIISHGFNSSQHRSLNASYVSIESKNISTSYNNLTFELGLAITELNGLESQLSSANTKKTNSVSKIAIIKSNLNSIKTDITQLKTSLEAISESISSIKVLNADSIVNPVKTTIKPITPNSDKSIFMLPFLVILVVMFIGIMLSGTSIIIDKMSPAAFRTFASPTKDSFYILAYYVTNILILLIQLLIIGGLSLFFFKATILSNIFLTILVIFLASTFFILVGMVFGYLFKSQETVTIASLSISSLFLFISNLIIPLETLPLAIQKISSYNPYVVFSELLRKTMLFNASIGEIAYWLCLMVVYILLMVVIILIIQKLAKVVFFRKPHYKKSSKMDLSININPEPTEDKQLKK
jgi:ABC-type multidrug transport system permease subunit